MTADSVMLISISVMLKRDFGRNTYQYIRAWQEYIIHCGPSFQQVKNTLYMYNISFSTLRQVVLKCLWIANHNKCIGATFVARSAIASLCQLEWETG